jgi:hypothetical protein
MNDRPTLVGIILCELVLQDVIRRDAISCVNIHSGIMAQAFPTQVPLIYAFAQLINVTKRFEYQFRVTSPKGEVIAESPLTPVEPMPNENVTHKIINAFTGLTFHEEGTFKIALVAGGDEIGHLPFQVVQIQLPQQQTALA